MPRAASPSAGRTASPASPTGITLTWDHDGHRPLAQLERKPRTRDEYDSRFFAIITDLVGTPTELVDESGRLARYSRSTLWGATTWNRDATAYTPLRFPGQYADPETALHYNLHRHYDPDTARYTTPDPLGLTPAPNPLAYVHNPHTWTDPLGLASNCPRIRVSHVHVGRDEVVIYPTHDGQIGAKPYTMEHGWASDRSVQQALDALHNDPALRQDLIDKSRGR